MAIYIYNGLPGSGKTTKLASVAISLFKTNKKIFEKYGRRRMIISNMKFSEKIETEYTGFYTYWNDLDELIKFKDCDIIIDEIQVYFDSSQWKELGLDIKRFLQIHRHLGINIYGTTQDFKMVDIAMRRLTKKAYWCRKMIGSRDISATLPDIKNPWGLIMLREIEFESFTSDVQEYKFALIPEFLFITKKLTEYFNTREEIENQSIGKLKHKIKKCSECGLTKIYHI